jgi:hypothetical protein
MSTCTSLLEPSKVPWQLAGTEGGLYLKQATSFSSLANTCGASTVTYAFVAETVWASGVPKSSPRTSDAARIKWAGSSGPDPIGLAKLHAAAATQITAKLDVQVRS